MSADSVVAGSVLNLRSVLLTSSGRSAIAAALRHAGVAPGAQVLLPNYYCPTMVAPIEAVGAKPVFYPLTPDAAPDWRVIAPYLEASREAASLPAALLVAHFFGHRIDLSIGRALCDRHGLILIEDCAHALYGGPAGAPIGSTGDYAIASLPKFLPVLQGGVLASARRDLRGVRLERHSFREEIKATWNLLEARRRWRSWRRAPWGHLMRPTLAARPPSSDVRRESLTDPLLLGRRARRAEAWIAAGASASHAHESRRRNYATYIDAFTRLPGAQPLFPKLAADTVPYVAAVEFEEPDRVYAALRAAHAPVFRWDHYWPGSNEDLAQPNHPWGHSVLQFACREEAPASEIAAFVARVLR